MLELGHAEGEILDVLASCETRLRQSLLDRLVASIAEPVELVAPRLDGVPDRAAHGVSVDAGAPGEFVRDLVGGLEAELAQPIPASSSSETGRGP